MRIGEVDASEWGASIPAFEKAAKDGEPSFRTVISKDLATVGCPTQANGGLEWATRQILNGLPVS
jgi:hypothetical protein